MTILIACSCTIIHWDIHITRSKTHKNSLYFQLHFMSCNCSVPWWFELFFLLSQIWVYGNSFEAFLVAVVNPRKEALEHWAEENGISMDFNSLCEDSRAKSYILEELSKLGKEKKVRSYISLLLLFYFVMYGVYVCLYVMLIRFHINLMSFSYNSHDYL